MTFTRAFIDLKVKEISKPVCERCYCETSPIPDCRRGCLGKYFVARVSRVGTCGHLWICEYRADFSENNLPADLCSTLQIEEHEERKKTAYVAQF